MRSRFNFYIILLTALGCEHHEKDSHTEVFKTPEQVAVDRRAGQSQERVGG